MNKDIEYALEYHERTKHSEISLMTSRHFLDWENRPFPFKIYLELPSIPLPADFPIPVLDTISSVNAKKSELEIKNRNNNFGTINGNASNKAFTIKELSSILFFSAGITREMKYDYGTFYMRAASATGALYPIEIYVICQDIYPNLQAGLYHFNPAEFSLVQIRKGDYRSILASTTTNKDHILTSPLTLIFTSIAWRNAWKYQIRSYRHWFWDGGVIAANLFATTTALGLYSRVIMGFLDDKVNDLLLLNSEKEASIAMASIGIGLSNDIGSNTENKAKETDILPEPKIRPLSEREIQYPEIWNIHKNSKLLVKEEVKEWIESGLRYSFNSTKFQDTMPIGHISKRQPLSKEFDRNTIASIGETILKRGSTRKFTRSSIPFPILSSILYNSTREILMDFKRDEDKLTDIYLIANDVKHLQSGAYFFNQRHNTLDFIKGNVSRETSGYLCLGQSLFSDASAVLFLMADLKTITTTLGNRGYRVAQFESGVIAGKIYLLAYAHGIGASGSTFFDDSVTKFFSPHSKDKNTMIAIGIGNPAYKARLGKVLPVRLSKDQLVNENVGNFK